MAQRSASRAVAKVKRTQKDVPLKKARASAVAKSTSKPVSPAPKTKTTAPTAAKKVTRAQKKPTVAVSKPGKAIPAARTAKSRTAAPKAQPAQKSKPHATRVSRPIEKPKLAPAAAKSSKARAAAKPKAERKGKSPALAAASPRVKRPSTTQQPLAYLAAELGQPVDDRGEPIGAGSSRAKSDTALQDYTLQLWRQMQSGRVVNRYTRAIERAGLTTDEVWTAGITEVRPTSSTSEEMRRYRQKLLFRANLLEAILSETVADLHRLDGIEPVSVETARESG